MKMPRIDMHKLMPEEEIKKAIEPKKVKNVKRVEGSVVVEDGLAESLAFRRRTSLETKTSQQAAVELMVDGVAPRDMRVMVMFAQGFPISHIAREVKLDSKSVRMILKTPPAIRYIAEYYESLDHQLGALYELSVHAVRDCLLCGDDKLRLEAAKHVHKVLGKDRPNGDEGKTAEDIMQEVMKAVRRDPDGTEYEVEMKRTRVFTGGDEEEG